MRRTRSSRCQVIVLERSHNCGRVFSSVLLKLLVDSLSILIDGKFIDSNRCKSVLT